MGEGVGVAGKEKNDFYAKLYFFCFPIHYLYNFSV